MNRCDVCFAGFIGRALTRHGYVWWENRGLLVEAEPFIAVSEGRAIYWVCFEVRRCKEQKE